jgi:hypothetical protein
VGQDSEFSLARMSPTHDVAERVLTQLLRCRKRCAESGVRPYVRPLAGGSPHTARVNEGCSHWASLSSTQGTSRGTE